jgi:hypothetical protein
VRGVFESPPEAMVAFEEVQRFVARLPDQDAEGRPVRCHEVARAAKVVLGSTGRFEPVDGHWGPYEHSWLVSRTHRRIIDPYAIGRLPIVQLVNPYLLCGADYEIGSVRKDIRWGVVERLIMASIRTTIRST